MWQFNVARYTFKYLMFIPIFIFLLYSKDVTFTAFIFIFLLYISTSFFGYSMALVIFKRYKNSKKYKLTSIQPRDIIAELYGSIFYAVILTVQFTPMRYTRNIPMVIVIMIVFEILIRFVIYALSKLTGMYIDGNKQGNKQYTAKRFHTKS